MVRTTKRDEGMLSHLFISYSHLPGHGEQRNLQLQWLASLTPSKAFVSEDKCEHQRTDTASVTCLTFVVGSWSNVCLSSSAGGFN